MDLISILKEANKADFEQAKQALIGKTLGEAERLLGYWWVLDDYTISHDAPCRYHYRRAGKGELTIETKWSNDVRDNVVVDVQGYFTVSNEYNDWRS